MKFFYFLASTLCLGAFSQYSLAENVLRIDDLTIGVGETTSVNVYLDNDDEIRQLGFEIILPEGVSVILPQDDPDEDFTGTTDRTWLKKTKFYSLKGTSYPNCAKFVLMSDNMYLDPVEDSDTDEDKAIAKIGLTSTVAYSGEKLYLNSGNASYNSTPVPVTFPIGVLGSTGYMSYSSSEDVLIEGATAYYGKVSGETLVLSEVPDNIIESQQGVVLQGAKGTTVMGTSVELVATPDNDLKATILGKAVTPKSVHVLSVEDGVVGFYVYDGTFIGNGKAYLEGVTLSRILFDTELAIESVSTENNIEAIFNLQGQKMTEAKKGINIVNGKKVMY